MSETTPKKDSLSPALIVVVLMLVSIAAPLNYNKIPPISSVLMSQFGISESRLGMLISVFSLAGILLALPGGFLIRRFGSWKCILAALLALLIGSVTGTGSGLFSLMLLSRVIEGVGMALIAVAGPSVISETVSPGRRGIAMGLFSAYMGIGQVLAYNLAPRIIHYGGWKTVWEFSTLYTAAAAIVWALLMLRARAFFKAPSAQKGPSVNRQDSSFFSLLKNRSIWYLTVSMSLYIISYVSIQTFLPTYLTAERGVAMANASSLVSVCCFTGTIFSIIAGILSDKLGSRRVLGGISLLLSAGLFLLIPVTPMALFLPLLIILGIIPPILPVCVFAAAPEVIDSPAKSGLAMGFISMGQNIGFFFGPILFSAFAQGFGWNAAFIFSAPAAVLGGAAMLFIKKAENSESKIQISSETR